MTSPRTFAFVAAVVVAVGCGGTVVVDHVSGNGGAGAGGSSVATSNGGGPASSSSTTVTTTVTSASSSSSSGGCGLSTGVPACDKCVNAFCCASAELCSADMTCLHCLTSQPPPLSCQMDPAFLGLASCALNNCGTACGTVSSSSSSAASSSSGTTTCLQGCGLMDPPGEQRFTTYELKRCGCVGATPPCAMVCAGTCANPSSLTLGSPCGQCLLAQEALKQGSPCTVTAALNDCQPDPVCAPFLACALQCP